MSELSLSFSSFLCQIGLNLIHSNELEEIPKNPKKHIFLWGIYWFLFYRFRQEAKPPDLGKKQMMLLEARGQECPGHVPQGHSASVDT